jgi:hypothetical protein
MEQYQVHKSDFARLSAEALGGGAVSMRRHWEPYTLENARTLL